MWSATDMLVVLIGVACALLGFIWVMRTWKQSRQNRVEAPRFQQHEEEIGLVVGGEDPVDPDLVRGLMLDFTESCPQVLLDPPPSVRVVQTESGKLGTEVSFGRLLGVGSFADLYAKLMRVLRPHHLRWVRIDEDERTHPATNSRKGSRTPCRPHR